MLLWGRLMSEQQPGTRQVTCISYLTPTWYKGPAKTVKTTKQNDVNTFMQTCTYTTDGHPKHVATAARCLDTQEPDYCLTRSRLRRNAHFFLARLDVSCTLHWTGQCRYRGRKRASKMKKPEASTRGTPPCGHTPLVVS